MRILKREQRALRAVTRKHAHTGLKAEEIGAQEGRAACESQSVASSLLITGRAVAELNWSWKASVSNYCQKYKIYKDISSQLGYVTESN